MTRILFIDDSSETLPALALACLNALSRQDIMGAACGINRRKNPDRDIVDTVLAEMGLSWPEVVPLTENIDFYAFDLVISFSKNKRKFYPSLPGLPPFIEWHLPEEKDTEGNISYQQIIHRIKELIDNLIDQGYLDAIAQIDRNSELLLDSMHEGIIAHDLRRKIFFFNKAAEKITGFSRQEIIGRDCHDVFSGGICKSNCSFKSLTAKHELPDSSYTLNIKGKDGLSRQLEMNVVEIRNGFNNPIGVMASFRDFTEEFEFASRLGEEDQFCGLVGRDPKMIAIYQAINELASSKVPVFIHGESGTGKELVAAAIHNLNKERKGLFVPVNCSAIPENLLESELFGHVKGAFTGAIRDKKGRFELADGGTLFLDEIGDISSGMQAKLLRVLQDGTFNKVGGEETVKVDVRLISATNKDLEGEIKAGRFRQDLYYRICIAPISLPPLRNRKNDIPLLARHFLNSIKDSEKKSNIVLSQDTIETLMNHDWPGNVRELQNAIRYLMFRCPDEVARPGHLPENIIRAQTKQFMPFRKNSSRQKLNKEIVREALRKTNNNRVKAAAILKVGRATLYRFLAKHKDL